MKRISTFLSLVVALLSLASASVWAQTYLTENFEAAWTGTPAAPPGWAQTRVVLLGDGVPDVGASGEKDWAQNVWSGTAWTFPSFTATNDPVGAQSGSGTLCIDDSNFGGTTTAGFGSRRVESPTMNLSTSTTPYVRFYYVYSASSATLNSRVMASSNGGTTWNSIMQITGNGAATITWQRINVLIPAAYRTATAKIGFEMTNTFGTANIFFDNLTVEEFTPTTITSAATGNWSAAATWTGGVVPNADNNVVIDVSQTVTADVLITRMQNLTVNGTFGNSATTTHLAHVFGNLTVNAGGTFNSFNAASGRRTYVGGNLVNDGTVNFSIGAGNLVWLGGAPATISGAGSFSTFVSNTWHANSGGVTYNTPIEVRNTVGLYVGTVNPNGNLTVGNSIVTTQTIERSVGSFTAAPIFGAGVTRSTAYIGGRVNFAPASSATTVPGEEVQDIGGTRTIGGTLTLNTDGNVSLPYPLQLGTATTGVMTLTRGILITTPTNLLTLSAFVAGSAGIAPSVVVPTTTHGSYIVGPMRINFPATGTTTRNFALGLGTALNGATPNANVRKTASLLTSGTAPWASETITASLGASPSGAVNPPLTAVFGSYTLRLNLNGGPDLSTKARLTIEGRNSTFGNSDGMLGAQGDLVVTQAPAPSSFSLGPWSQRSLITGSGAFVDNTAYTRTTDTLSPGPIGPLATNGEYFALGTVAAGQAYDSSRVTQDTVSSVASGGRNVQVIGIKINATGSLAPLTVSQFTVNTTGTTSAANLDSAKLFYTGTTPTFSTTTRFGSAVANPSGSFNISGSQLLTGGSNYFWLAYDVKITAPSGNVIDGECTSVTIGGTPRTPSVTAPAGNRPIVSLNSGGPFGGGYFYANNYATSAPSSPTYSWVDPLTASPIPHTKVFNSQWTNADDGIFGPVLIGFPFTYFGTTKDSVYIHTNGFITFQSTASPFSNTTLPSATSPLNMIGLAWDDLDIDSVTYPNGAVYYQGGPTQFVVTYYRVHHFASATDTITCQVILYPDGNIKMQYNDLLSNTAGAAGSTIVSSTVGFQDTTGTLALLYRFDGIGGPMFASPVAVMYGTNVNTLPVQLASFTARTNQGGGVRLDWRTISEINNYGFYVERRLNTEQSYTLVPNSFQPGYGTTNEPHDYFFIDRTVTPGTYFYRLRQQDLNGTIHLTEPITITYGVTSAGNEAAPREFSLKQNYPNPFNPTTEIKFSVENTDRATLEIYNLLGQKVATLFDDVAEAGQYYRVKVNAAQFASGMYIYRLQSGVRTDLKKMLLLK